MVGLLHSDRFDPGGASTFHVRLEVLSRLDFSHGQYNLSWGGGHALHRRNKSNFAASVRAMLALLSRTRMKTHGAPMPRYCLTLDLQDDPHKIAEYKRHHEKIWPEIRDSLYDAGVTAMEIYLAGTRIGANLYNLVHITPLPAAVIALAWWQHWPLAGALGLIWLAHIGMDRLLGYGLKYHDHFQHTHLSQPRRA